jgi:hypothetical protein
MLGTTIKIAEVLLAEPNALEFEITLEKVKRFKSNVAELIQTEEFETHKLTDSVWNKQELPQLCESPL